jgi:hypothetical protein
MAEHPLDNPDDRPPTPPPDADADAGGAAADPEATGVPAANADGDDDIPFGDPGDDDDRESRWDADDPRRQNDQMAPPSEPCECYCLHCGRTFTSDKIWFQKVIGSKDGFDGFWMCPTANCGGAGFTFDIFPTDPDHPANSGWTYTDDDEEEWDEESDDLLPAADVESPDKEYDPDETKYKRLDELYGDDDDDEADDDLEGEEWKYGLQPGERPDSSMNDEMRRQRDEEEKKYDMPDERPRELDWTNREEEKRPPRGESSSGNWEDDDIPF